MQSRAPTRLSPHLACALAALALFAAPGRAAACDGRSYDFNITPGATVSGGGVTVRLDQEKLLDDVPDKYYISVKDDGTVLAEDTLLHQHDTVKFKTKCGTLSIGADRAHFFSNTLALTWSYF
jgi:hypothetical protein